MAARRGDNIVDSNIKSAITTKHDTEVSIPDITETINSVTSNVEANGDQAPLIDPATTDCRNESIFDNTELYTGFQKITTIPAAALSIVAGFIMIASVCNWISYTRYLIITFIVFIAINYQSNNPFNYRYF